jgi:polygalacturonase
MQNWAHLCLSTLSTGAGIAIGSEIVGGIRNVMIERNSVDFVADLVRLKGCRRYGGYLRNVTWAHNHFEAVQRAVFAEYVTDVIDVNLFTIDQLLL